MKKFVKVSLMAAGILAVTGVILCLVSIAMGGTITIHNNEFMERRIEAAEEVLENISESFSYGSHDGIKHMKL